MPIVHDLKKRFPMWQLQHQAVVTVENIFDTEYRQHLSRIKWVMPEPGRNVKLLYRLNF
jgi:iron complex outermembrane receptor protein